MTVDHTAPVVSIFEKADDTVYAYANETLHASTGAVSKNNVARGSGSCDTDLTGHSAYTSRTPVAVAADGRCFVFTDPAGNKTAAHSSAKISEDTNLVFTGAGSFNNKIYTNSTTTHAFTGTTEAGATVKVYEAGLQPLIAPYDADAGAPLDIEHFENSYPGDDSDTYLVGNIVDTGVAQDITFRHPAKGVNVAVCPFYVNDNTGNPFPYTTATSSGYGGCSSFYRNAETPDSQFTETTLSMTLNSKMRTSKGVVFYTGLSSDNALTSWRYYSLQERTYTERGSATADGSGAVSGTISPAFTAGEEKGIYTGITPSGTTAESDKFAALTLVVDTTAPATPTVALASGISASSGDATPEFTVTAEAGASVQLYTDQCTTATGTAATVAAGDTTVDVETGTLAVGSYTIYAKQTDPAGNASDCSATPGVAYERLNITAAISTSSPLSLDENNLNDATVTVTLSGTTFTDPLNTSHFSVDGIAGLTADDVSLTNSTTAVLTLDFTAGHATDFDTDDSFTITVKPAGHAGSGNLTTGSKSVTADTETVTVAVAAHAPAAINGDNLNNAQIDVTLTSARFVSGTPTVGNFTVNGTGITGLSADGAIRVDDDTVRLTLHYTSTPLTADGSFTVTVVAAAHDNASAVTSASFSVSATPRLALDLTAASDTGVSDTDDETKDTTPSFTVTRPGNRQFGTSGDTVHIFTAATACADTAAPTAAFTVASPPTGWIPYGTDPLSGAITTTDITGSAISATTRCFFTALSNGTTTDFATHSNPLEVVIDTTAPAPAAAPTLIARHSPLTATGTDDTLEVEVTAPVGSTVQIYTDRQCTAASRTGTDRVTVPAGGTATLTTTPLADGTHTIYAATVDTAGNARCLTTGVDYTVEKPITLVSNPATLTEATLDGATVTLTIKNSVGVTFDEDPQDTNDFRISGPTGLTVGVATRDSDTRRATLTLAFTGDFDTDQTLSFTVDTDALVAGTVDLLSSTVTVTANHADELQNPSAAAGDTQVTLSWTQAPETGATYEYQQKAGSGNYGSWTTISNDDITGTTTKSYIVTGLTNATTYSFKVRAVTAGGDGVPSAEVSATPVDSTAPTISVVSIASDNTDTAYAAEGDTITLSFTASERLSTSGTSVTIAGRTGGDVSITETSSTHFTYTATTTVASGTTEGAVTFSVTPQDTVGNNGTAHTAVTDTSDVTVDTTAPVVSIFEKADDTIYAYANETLHASTGAVSKNNVASGSGSCDTDLTGHSAYTPRDPVAEDATNGRCFVFTDPAGNKTAAHSSTKISENTNLAFTDAGSFDGKHYTKNTRPAFTGSTAANAEVKVYEYTESLAYTGAAPNPAFYHATPYFAGYAIVGNIHDTVNSQSITLNHHQGGTRGFLCPYITPVLSTVNAAADPDCIELYNNASFSENKVEHTYTVTLNSAMRTANAVLWRMGSYNNNTTYSWRYAPLYEKVYTERGSATADGSGDFSDTISSLSAFTAGEHNVYTTITPSGTTVESDRFSALTLVVDEIAPAAPTVIRASGTPASSADTTPTFRVTAEAGASVQLYTDRQCTTTTGTAATVAVGATTVNIETDALGVGSHTIYAKQTDPAGNVSDCSASGAAYQVVSAAAVVSASNPDPLTEGGLNDATVTVTLTGTTFTNPLNTTHFSVDGIAGLTADDVSRTNNTTAVLTLNFTAGHATDFDTDDSFTVTVLDAGHTDTGDLTTGSKAVTAVAETVTAAVAAHTPATINGDNLNDATVDVTLTSARFVSGTPTVGNFTVNGTGITGLSADGATREDDDTVRLTLHYTGTPLTADGSFTVTVVAAAHDNAVAVTSASFSVPATPRLALDLTATSDTGVSDTDNETKDDTPTFTVTRPGNRQFGTSGDTVHIFTVDTACADTAAPTAAVTVASPPDDWVQYGTKTLTSAVTTTNITGSALTQATRCFFTALSNGTTTDFATHSDPLEVVIDTTAPAPAAAPTLIARHSPLTATGTDDTLEVEVTANDGSTVQIYTNNQCTDASRTGTDRETVPTTGGATGIVNLTTGTLSQGTHTIYAATVDVAGNARCLTTGVDYTVERPLTLAASNPATLTEATLNGASVTLTIGSGETFNTGTLNIPHFVPSGPTGLTVSAATLTSSTVVTLTLAFTGDFDTDQTLSFTVNRAAHSGGTELDSSTVTIAANHADPLQNPVATAGDGEVTLRWTQAPEVGVDGYEYRQKAGSGNYGSWTAMSGITTTATTKSYTVTGLTNATAYTFEIRAVVGADKGAASAEVSATPVDTTAPTISVVSIVSDNTDTAYAKVGDTITLSFTASERLSTSGTSATIAGRTGGDVSINEISSSDFTYTATTTVASGTTEGAVTFSVTPQDTVGNDGTAYTAVTDSTTMTIDTTDPVVSVFEKADSTVYAYANETTGAVSKDAVLSGSCSTALTAPTAYTSRAPVAEDATNGRCFVFTDPAGNKTAAHSSAKISEDTSLSFTGAGSFNNKIYTNTTTPAFTGSIGTTGANAEVKVYEQTEQLAYSGAAPNPTFLYSNPPYFAGYGIVGKIYDTPNSQSITLNHHTRGTRGWLCPYVTPIRSPANVGTDPDCVELYNNAGYGTVRTQTHMVTLNDAILTAGAVLWRIAGYNSVTTYNYVYAPLYENTYTERGSATASGSGAVSGTISTAFTAGENNVYTGITPSGTTVESDRFAALTLVVDEIAPAAPTLVSASGASGTDTTPTFRVTAEAGASVRLYTNNQCTTATGTAATVAVGDTTVDIETDALGVGTHTIYAKQTDPAGNASDCSTSGAAYQITSSVSAAVSSTSPSTLTENNLNDATVTVTLTGTAFVNASSLDASDFDITGITGLTADDVSRTDATNVVLTLDFADGSDFDTDDSFTVTVNQDDHTGSGNLTTGSTTVTANHADELEDVAAAAVDRGVTLSWTRAPETVTGYEYRQKAGSGNYGSWTTMTSGDITTSADTKSYTVTGLTNATAYTFEIRAVTSGGDGVPSAEVSATPAPPEYSITAPAADSTIAETTGATLTVTVTGNRATASGGAIRCTVTPDATGGQDGTEHADFHNTATNAAFTAAPTATATFAAEDTSANCVFTLTDDTDDEPAEHFTVTLSSPPSGGITGATYHSTDNTRDFTIAASDNALTLDLTTDTGDDTTDDLTNDDTPEFTVTSNGAYGGTSGNDLRLYRKTGTCGTLPTETTLANLSGWTHYSTTDISSPPAVLTNTGITSGTALANDDDYCFLALLSPDGTNINTASYGQLDISLDTQAPTPAFINDVSDPGVRSDTILVSADEAGFTGYGYSDDTTCAPDETANTISNKPLTHLQRITVNSNNGKHLCYRAEDTAGNTAYLVSAYTLDINTAETNSDDAELSDLSLSAGTLAPALTSGTHAYTATVANSVTTVTVTADPNNDEALVTAITADTDTTVENGVVDLTVGDNVITVSVIAQDGAATQDYTLTVTRYGTDTRPDSFSFTAKTGVESSATVTSDAITPAGFNAPTTFSVTDGDLIVDGNNEGTSGTVNPDEPLQLELTASSSFSTPKTATLTLDGTVSGTFTATTRAARTNANLSALTVSGVTLSFAAGTYSYTGSVANSVAQVTVGHTAADNAASVIVTPADANDGTAGHQVDLTAGESTDITVEVTAEDGTTTKEYTVAVTRLASASSSAAPGSPTLVQEVGGIAPYTASGTHRTRDTTPTISFTAVSGATTEVEYHQGNTGVFTGTGVTHTSSGTTRTAVLPTLSTNGIYRVRITQDEDGSGGPKTPTAVTYSFILDTQAPTVTPTVAKNGHTTAGGVDYLNTGDTLTVTFSFNEDMSATVLTGKFINNGTDIPSSGGSHHTVTPARTNATTQTLTLTVTDAGPDVAANTLEYHLTNGTSLTDLAGNAFTAQDETAIANTVIDTTAPTLSPTKTGTDNTATYKVAATDNSPVTGRTKDAVASADCTAAADTATWDTYTPGADTGAADDDDGRCVIITDAAGNSAAQHLDDDDGDILSDFTLDITGDGAVGTYDAIAHYIYEVFKAQAPNGRQAMTPFLTGGDDAATVWSRLQASAATRDFSGNGDTDQQDAIIHYIYEVFKDQEPNGRQAMVPFLTGAGANTGAAVFTLLNGYAGR